MNEPTYKQLLDLHMKVTRANSKIHRLRLNGTNEQYNDAMATYKRLETQLDELLESVTTSNLEYKAIAYEGFLDCIA
jgi:hypothetical protein